MAKLIQFIPRAELDADQNIREFIWQCRDGLDALGAHLPFDENVWDISDDVERKGRTSRVRVVFSSLAAAKANQRTPTMAESFLPFAKAYFRYFHALKPTNGFANRLAALRLVTPRWLNWSSPARFRRSAIG